MRSFALVLVLALLPASAARADDAEVRSIVRAWDRARHRLYQLLDEARLRRDRTQVRCVDRQLSQVNALGRAIDRSARALKVAEGDGDAGEGRVQRARLRALFAQLRDREDEGVACVQPVRLVPGRVRVHVRRPD